MTVLSKLPRPFMAIFWDAMAGRLSRSPVLNRLPGLEVYEGRRENMPEHAVHVIVLEPVAESPVTGAASAGYRKPPRSGTLRPENRATVAKRFEIGVRLIVNDTEPRRQLRGDDVRNVGMFRLVQIVQAAMLRGGEVEDIVSWKFAANVQALEFGTVTYAHGESSLEEATFSVVCEAEVTREDEAIPPDPEFV